MRDRDLILLGAPPAQPLLSAWTASVPLESGVNRVGVNPNPIRPRWLHPEWPFREADRGRLASLLAARPRIDMIVEQFVSPFRSDRSVVAIVPGPSYGTMSGLLRPAVRNGPVYGGVALALAGQFQSFLVGNLTYRSGDPRLDQRAIVWLFEHYQLLPAFVVLLALVIALEVRRATERVAARRVAAARM